MPFQNPRGTLTIVAIASDITSTMLLLLITKNKKYATGAASNYVTSVLNFIIIGQLVQILKWRPTYGQAAWRSYLLLFLLRKYSFAYYSDWTTFSPWSALQQQADIKLLAWGTQLTLTVGPQQCHGVDPVLCQRACTSFLQSIQTPW